jgi:hypothetical protein
MLAHTGEGELFLHNRVEIVKANASSRSSRRPSTSLSLRAKLSNSRSPARSTSKLFYSGSLADLMLCSAVHLIGNYINQVPYEPESDSEFSGSDDYSELEDEELDEDEEEAIKGYVKQPP